MVGEKNTQRPLAFALDVAVILFTMRHRKFETQTSSAGVIIAFRFEVPPPVNNTTVMRSPLFHIMYKQIAVHSAIKVTTQSCHVTVNTVVCCDLLVISWLAEQPATSSRSWWDSVRFFGVPWMGYKTCCRNTSPDLQVLAFHQRHTAFGHKTYKLCITRNNTKIDSCVNLQMYDSDNDDDGNNNNDNNNIFPVCPRTKSVPDATFCTIFTSDAPSRGCWWLFERAYLIFLAVRK